MAAETPAEVSFVHRLFRTLLDVENGNNRFEADVASAVGY